MKKRKDNLTDLVERLPQAEISSEPKEPKNQQVVDSDGELITLGQKPRITTSFRTYGKLHELTKKEIEEIVKTTIDEEMDRAAVTIVQKVERMLKEKGFI